MIISDKDILEDILEVTNIFDNGIKKSIFDHLHWLCQQIGRNLLARRENLRDQNPGAVPYFHTKVIWVKMLSRPISDDPKLSQVWRLRRKYNDVMDDLLDIEEYMHILNIHDMEEFKYFDNRGNLTSSGKHQFWLNFNDQLKSFEYNKCDLRPVSSGRSANPTSHRTDRYDRNEKQIHPATNPRR